MLHLLRPCTSFRPLFRLCVPLDLQVQTMQKFRKQLPESTKVFICKNNLMRVATQQTEGWSTLADKGLKVLAMQ